MRFLAGFFGMAMLVSLAWTFGGPALSMATVQQAPDVNNPALSVSDNQAVNGLSRGVFGGLSLGFFACTGLPATGFFMVLALVCFSSAQRQQQHEEMLYAQMVRNDTLGNMSVTQLAQAQMQFEEQQYRRSAHPQGQILDRFPDEVERETYTQEEFLKRQNKRRRQQGWYRDE